ncbi:hypothetical protein HUG20_04245 [Salicibibacter cibi]|uniref:Uncharacterized protein n=1 Tax=Salicibibacter cibi TaxID=2743001 RepID=A0A7T6Z943_9BACI|nr:hypothetical protein [Salicibibacter cibi]QQK79185.1 hypothetical protein HUG20_04245 [Salicibibacter cibi]
MFAAVMSLILLMHPLNMLPSMNYQRINAHPMATLCTIISVTLGGK